MAETVPAPTGQYGKARPAFTVHRFKRTIPVMMNEEMADAVLGVLEDNENRLKAEGKQVPPFLFEFANQLDDALNQKPPALGEKPEVLAPGRKRTA